MNQHVPIEAYGYRDFLLIRAPRADVETALKAGVLENDMDLDFEVQPVKLGFFMRLLLKLMGQGDRIDEIVQETQRAADETNAARAEMGPIETDAVSLHRGDAARAVDMTAEQGPAYGAHHRAHDIFQNDVRLWSIEGSDWVLVEYKETVSGMSMLGFQVSLQLAGHDVLYFRQSGAKAAEGNFDFHVYRDGETARRVLCHATWANGKEAEEWWEGQSDGALTAYERAEMYAGATEETLLDNAGIEMILDGMGLSTHGVFEGGQVVDPLLFSRRAGGEPLVVEDHA